MTGTLSSDVPQLDAAEGAEAIAGGAYLLDVREDDEWAAGHAPAAHHLALGAIAARLAEVPADAEIVAVCRAGGRSQKAAEFLRSQGIDARNLAGGMQAWAAAGLTVVTDSGATGSVI